MSTTTNAHNTRSSSIKTVELMIMAKLNVIEKRLLELKYATYLTEEHLYLYIVRGSMLQTWAHPISFLIILSFIYRCYLIATCLFSTYQATAPTCYLSGFPALPHVLLKRAHLLYIALFIALQPGGWKFTFLWVLKTFLFHSSVPQSCAL